MVAFRHTDLHSCEPSACADQYVQPLGDWPVGREALWLSKVCGLLGCDRVAGVVASYLTVIPGARPGLIASFIIKRADEPSAGASGALFGLVGVLFVFGLKYRRELPEGFKRAFGTGMLPVILLNLGIGFLGRGIIDNAAHLGGLLSGAAIASLVSYKRPGTPASVTIAWRVLQIAALVLVGVCFLMVARHFG